MMKEIARITSTHGIKGEVKIANLSDYDRFKEGITVLLALNDVYHPLVIERVRVHKNKVMLTFKDYENINLVLPFIGKSIYTEAAGTLQEDEYSYQALIGKKAVKETKEFIGIIESVIEVPQGHLLEIINDKKKKILIPFVKAFVGEITETDVTIFPIEGML